MGVALAAAAVWAVTLRKVELLAGQPDDSLPSPAPPPPPPSKQQEVVGGDGSYSEGAGAEGEAGSGGLRRRVVRGGDDRGGVSALSSGDTAHTNTSRDIVL